MLDVAGEVDGFAPGGIVVEERFTGRVGVRLLALEMKEVPRHVGQCGPREYVPAARIVLARRASQHFAKCFFTAPLQVQALVSSAGASRIRMAPRRVARMRLALNVWMTRLA